MSIAIIIESMLRHIMNAGTCFFIDTLEKFPIDISASDIRKSRHAPSCQSHCGVVLCETIKETSL